MKLIAIDNFNWRGTVSDVDLAGVKALSIAPSSVVDRCLVGGQLLTPRSIVPVTGARELTAVRGWRHGDVTLTGVAANAETSPTAYLNEQPTLAGALHLLAYECGDTVAACGERAAVETVTRTAQGAIPSGAGNYALALRMLVHGRKRGTVMLRRGDGAVGDPSPKCRMVVRLIKYWPRHYCAGLRQGAYDGWDGHEMVAEQVADLYPANVSAVFTANGALAQVVHWGGEDSWEEADELEVWLGEHNGDPEEAPDTATDWWLIATASGEV